MNKSISLARIQLHYQTVLASRTLVKDTHYDLPSIHLHYQNLAA